MKALILIVVFSRVENITLRAGETYTLRFDGVERVAINDPSIADVRVLEGGEVLLTGLSAGTTTLTVWHKKGTSTFTVNVLSRDPLVRKRALEKALGEIEGISVNVVDEKVIVEGEILRESDLEKFREVIKAFPDVVVSVKTPKVFMKKMVELDVKMIELSDGGRLKVGFDFPSLISISGNGNFSMNNLDKNFSLSVVSGLSFIVNLLAFEGRARILSNPVLVCVSGDTARFTAGGEIPVPKSGSLGTVDITWKEFGTILEFKPVVGKDNSLELHIKAETSDIDPSRSVNISGFTMPAFITRKSETTVNLKEGDTLVIAELISRMERKGVNKFPLLGHIPIFGEFFKSRSIEKDERKFYILITPRILVPESESGRESEIINEYMRMKRKMGIGVFD